MQLDAENIAHTAKAILHVIYDAALRRLCYHLPCQCPQIPIGFCSYLDVTLLQYQPSEHGDHPDAGIRLSFIPLISYQSLGLDSGWNRLAASHDPCPDPYPITDISATLRAHSRIGECLRVNSGSFSAATGRLSDMSLVDRQLRAYPGPVPEI